MANIKCYRRIILDENNKVIDNETCVPTDFKKLGLMIYSGIGELGNHIYEEYEDNTRFEIALIDPTVYDNYVSQDNGICHIKPNK